MKDNKLLSMIKKGESGTLEFKENFDNGTIETASAFANTNGGVILIGVSDRGQDIYTEEYLLKLGLNERQIKAVMFVKEKGKITNKGYQKITTVSKPTASRELAMLVGNDILEQQGITGKGTFYIIKTAHKGLKRLAYGSQRVQTPIKAGNRNDKTK